MSDDGVLVFVAGMVFVFVLGCLFVLVSQGTENYIAESCTDNGFFIAGDDVYQCRLVRPAQQGGAM